MKLRESIFQKGKISYLPYFTCKIKPKNASFQLYLSENIVKQKKGQRWEWFEL